MKKFAVVIAGCGFKDGAEITESVSTLIALSEAQVEYKIFAPNIEVPSSHHITDAKTEARNVLTESARIARGEIEDTKDLKPADFDAIIFPGGYGAALHLCDFAKSGSKAQALPEIKKIIEAFYTDSKPIGAFCIAPALIATVLGDKGITVTIGNDSETAKEIEKLGATHINCAVTDFITDRESKVVTTPAYMYDAKPYEVFTGIRKAVFELVEMA